MDLFDIFQNFRIRSAQRQATEAKYSADSQKTTLAQLEDQIDHLSLVCAAICELMEEIGFDRKMLAKKIEEIDLRDGKLDGEFTHVVTCNSCERKVAARHVQCLYCGSRLDRG